MNSRVQIFANGKAHPIEPGSTLNQFLNHLGLVPGQVVVERNEQALTPSEAPKVILQDGDRLEIVQIVAGG